ncbi:MAG TPA: SRPBCC domain-containing protein [Solirubrobacterales bacterium]|nr:SRPBCC domain-containing protein [Solirubrobacterales bacterium]
MSAEAMAAEKIEIDLAAPPARVYDALATEAGVIAWWTEGTFAEEVGGVGRLAFGSGWTELQVEKLVPEREVEWTCVGQSIEHFDPTDEWVGTRITFRLKSLDGERTHLEFAHHGLAGLSCEAMCVNGWDHYIRVSLRGLVEAGQGAAGAGAGSRST